MIAAIFFIFPPLWLTGSAVFRRSETACFQLLA